MPVAVQPNTQMQYFDVVTKSWKLLPSMPQANERNQACFCAEYVGNYLYVAAKNRSNDSIIYRYDTVNNSWGALPPFLGSSHQINCLCSDNDYIYAISVSSPPQKYSLANNNWQSSGGNLSFFSTKSDKDKLSNVSAVVLKSKIYVIHGYQRNEGGTGWHCRWEDKPAVVHCFDPAKNEWKQKASTCQPHFGSSLFVVNNRLFVAGGKTSQNFPAPVEVYNEENNTWSVVEQKHIPPNKLGAVEIEGRVYFIINKFPIDSGIRNPPEEDYHVSINEWENLAKASSQAVLCYLPVKRENLKAKESQSQTD